MTEHSLRERKYAATKAALMQAVIARLPEQPLDEIAVKDVCHEVQVSETTFFNYFPTKQDVIVYRVQLWSIEVAWAMQQRIAAGGTHLDAIRAMFALTGQREDENPGVMAEIVARQALARDDFSFAPLTPAEYAHHFPDAPGIERLSSEGIDRLLLEQLNAAQAAGELPAGLDVQALGMTLMAIFFVTPVMVRLGLGADVQGAYQRQLKQLLRIA